MPCGACAKKPGMGATDQIDAFGLGVSWSFLIIVFLAYATFMDQK